MGISLLAARGLLPSLAKAAVCAGISTLALAQPKDGFSPSEPVTVIVPYGPGTGIDIMARTIAQELGVLWSQPVVVRNQPGASGNIGATAAANAKPDGTTFVIIANSHLINQHISKNVVDTERALTALAPAGQVPYLLTVSSTLPARSISELVALAKDKPGELNYSGVYGSVPHLLGVALSKEADIDIKFVSYKSTTDATTDAVSGRVPIWFTTVASAMPLIQADKIRPLAVTGSQRVQGLPEAPTVVELGYPSLDLGSAFYFMLPGATPGPVVEAMNRDITQAMTTPAVIRKLAEQGIEANTSTPQELASLLKAESERWKELVEASGIQPAD